MARRFYGNVSASVKSENNNYVLTEADLAIGKMIVSVIQREYPAHNIIDEELGVIDKGSNFTWVVDPIDGTSNFAAATPLYGCMIGVLKDGVPLAGGVTLPSLNQTYIAEKGSGATCNGTPIHVSYETNLIDVLVAYGIDGHPEAPELTRAETRVLNDLILSIRNLRTSNSAYDLMMVATGSYGALANKTSKIWDNVAPHIIIEEAGGLYTDYSGKPVNYHGPLERSQQNFTVCTANTHLHAAMQTILHQSTSTRD